MGDTEEAVGRLRGLDLVLTAECNLRCAYCYQSRSLRGSMSEDTLRAAVDLVRRSRGPAVTLAFYGGEPLLERALLRRAVEYASGSRPGRSPVRFHLTTNGTLLDADAAAAHARVRGRRVHDPPT